MVAKILNHSIFKNVVNFKAGLILLLTVTLSYGQSVKDNTNVVTVLMAKALIDVQNGKTVVNPVLYIRNGKIEKIGTGLPIPDGAKIINLSDKYILPGLIDAHTHLCHEYYGELERVSGANIIIETVKLTEGDRALLGAKYAREMLMSGYTSVRDLGNSGMNSAVALRDAINKGWIIGPRLFVTTRALSPIGGQFSKMTPEVQNVIISKEYIEINSIDDARKAVRQAIYDGADCIKIIVNNGRLVLSEEELTAIVDEAKRAGLKVAAHATNGDGPSLLAIKAGVSSIEHGYTLSSEVLQLMAEKNIYLVPTDAQGVERYQKRIQRAVAAKVKIAFGSDLYYYNASITRGQMAASSYGTYKEAGMTNLQILQSATMHPGDLLAGEGKIGLLLNGYFADIIAVEENPLDNIRTLEKVVFVMKEGEIIK
ncbi:amidohydrolase family protein [Emticicia sp. C21]|uniref:amidohydrolase family protein n=1 Tax=Emticicia sp. C21 TaxID=2302915 RepID=UPI000E355B40|nr:amidohydrolase family protein [Emticicia sp. C21]RFS16282.1 amidohydrolase family protein [Emticicia sp. C21]